MEDMSKGLVAGLFGLSPQQEYQRMLNQQQAQATQAANTAGLTPGQIMAQAYSNMGSSAVNLGAGMLGIEPAGVAEARQRREMMQGADTNSPEGLIEVAKRFRAANMPEQALMAEQAAMKLQMGHAEMAKNAAQTRQAEAAAWKSMQPEDEKISEYAKWLIEAGYIKGSPEFNAKMKELIESEIKGKAQGRGTTISLDVRDPRNWKIVSAEKGDRERISLANQMTSTTFRKIDNLLSDKKMMVALFGKAYSGYATSLTNPDARKRLESIKDTMKQAGIAMTKDSSGQSIGQITEREWPILEGMINRIDYSLTEEEAERLLIDVKTQLKNMRDIYTSNYHESWGQYPEIYRPDIGKGKALEEPPPPIEAKTWNSKTGKWE